MESGAVRCVPARPRKRVIGSAGMVKLWCVLWKFSGGLACDGLGMLTFGGYGSALPACELVLILVLLDHG